MVEDKEEGKRITVVTVRCIDMVAPHIDSWKKACNVCGEMTWISASWKEKKIDEIICETCWFTNYKDRKDYNVCVTETNIDEFREWVERHHDKRLTRKEVIKLLEQQLLGWNVDKKMINIVKSSEDTKI